jgi:hypothetical protein
MDREEQEEALPTSIVVIDIFIRFFYIYIYISKDDIYRHKLYMYADKSA